MKNKELLSNRDFKDIQIDLEDKIINFINSLNNH